VCPEDREAFRLCKDSLGFRVFREILRKQAELCKENLVNSHEPLFTKLYQGHVREIERILKLPEEIVAYWDNDELFTEGEDD
jgi:hypothetical protein